MFRSSWHTWLHATAFVRTPDHKRDVDTYSRREFQGCKGAKAIWEGWQLQVG